MAIKKRLVECDCGERFEEDPKGHLTGNVDYLPWTQKNCRLRGTKSPIGGEIVQVTFVRSVECKSCKGELFREKNEYDVTPGQVAREQRGLTVANYVREMVVSQDAIHNTDNSNLNLNGKHKQPSPPPEPPQISKNRPSDPIITKEDDSSLNLAALHALSAESGKKPKSSPSMPVIHLSAG